MSNAMLRVFLPALTMLLFAGSPGCADPDSASVAEDLAVAAVAPAPAGLSTESSTYRFRGEGVIERTSIPYAYHNVGTGPLYHPTCRSPSGTPVVMMMIERLEEGNWHPVWMQERNDCLSEPIIIRPGETYMDTLEVILHPQDSIKPGKLVPGRDVEGTYRLVWTQLLRNYDAGDYPFGEEIPLSDRASAPFGMSR